MVIYSVLFCKHERSETVLNRKGLMLRWTLNQVQGDGIKGLGDADFGSERRGFSDLATFPTH